MKFAFKTLVFLSVLSASLVNCFSLDREAFTFTSYGLDIRVEPEQQRLAARGKITLRNDSPTPQKIAVLQISFSLGWRSIKAGGKQLQFVSQTYTSDIDHTGALSEAIVTLPEAVAPKGTVDLEIAYEGIIVLDATRLTRIGTPEAQANSSDWDQISTKFTAVRGIGYVAWYPIATETADISEATGLFETVARWKIREGGSRMRVQFEESGVLGPACISYSADGGAVHYEGTSCTLESLGTAVPTFVKADYAVRQREYIAVHYLKGHDASAVVYADAAESVLPLLSEWFGKPHVPALTAELPDPHAAPFESGSLLLTPLGSDPKLASMVAVHQLTHAAYVSPRPWINEGLAHFAQALYLEHQSGRPAALDYMVVHSSGFRRSESNKEKQTTVPGSEGEANRSLINPADEELYRSKAMCVWWMLRDMVGDQALKKALASYHPDQDKEPSYMSRLIQAQTQRDLEWFFDDWVYRDRGLPEFKIASVFPRKTLKDSYILTVTVDNLGAAGAEVPLKVKVGKEEITKRIEVRAKSNAVIRVEVSALPVEIVVNDGSVPESDRTNNVFRVEPSDAAK